MYAGDLWCVMSDVRAIHTSYLSYNHKLETPITSKIIVLGKQFFHQHFKYKKQICLKKKIENCEGVVKVHFNLIAELYNSIRLHESTASQIMRLVTHELALLRPIFINLLDLNSAEIDTV